jgi:hypothetical protein
MDVGRTRWRRFGVVMVLSAGATAGLLSLVASGAVAATFSVSGQQFKVSADKLVADGFVQYGTVDARTDPGSNPPSQLPEPVAVAAMKNATLTNLCQSVVTDLGDFGSLTLTITAGTGKNPVTAENMVVDMSQLNGNALFTDIEIGRDASTLDKGPTNDPGEIAQRRQGCPGRCRARGIHGRSCASRRRHHGRAGRARLRGLAGGREHRDVPGRFHHGHLQSVG